MLHELHVYHDADARSAAMNMAVDEALLEFAREPSLRFYGWRQASLSFGYFGSFKSVAGHQPHREIVRRWTGGGTVFHGGDLTYSLILPAGDAGA
ncbi:MAG: octanoyltransferase, partial [Chthoniobacterales bacterium]